MQYFSLLINFDNRDNPWLDTQSPSQKCHQGGITSVENKFLGDYDYRQTSNIRRTWVGNKIVDHLDVVGASPVGAAPTTSSFST